MKQTPISTGMGVTIALDGQIKWARCDAMFDIIVGMLDNGIELSYPSYWLNDMWCEKLYSEYIGIDINILRSEFFFKMILYLLDK